MQGDYTQDQEVLQEGLYVIEAMWPMLGVYRAYSLIRVTDDPKSVDELMSTVSRLEVWSTHKVDAVGVRARRVAN